MTDPKFNLVYIASIGRSGSTLLDSMLGAHSAMATTGELHIWPHEILEGGVRPCSCGAYVQDCAFWVEMRRRVDPLAQDGPPLHHFRELHNAGRTLRWSRLHGFGATATDALDDRDEIMAYGRNNLAIFQTYADVIDEQHGFRPTWLVDASKDPYRLLWLARSGLFNLKVIHLVKNPRGFVYSVTKPYLDEHGVSGLRRRLYYAARQSGAWVVHNDLISRTARHHLADDAYLLVNYETLAKAPHATFERICSFIGCPYEPKAVEQFRQGSVHTIAGNPMRYEKRSIRLDERWKTKLPSSSRRVAEVITGPVMARYGYR